MADGYHIVDGRHRCVPPSFVPRSPVAGGWPVVPVGLAGQVLAVANQLLENEWREPEQIRARQLESLQSLLTHAARYSPFHAERFRAAGLAPEDVKSLADLRRVPLMTRLDTQAGFDAIRCTALPKGTQFLDAKETSGSTGIPARVVDTNVRGVMWLAMTLRSLLWAGMDPMSHLAAIRPVCIKIVPLAHEPSGVASPSWGGAMGQCFVTGPSSVMNIQMGVREQAEFVHRAKAQCLLTYPSIVDDLIGYMEKHGMSLPDLRVVQTISEVLTARTIRRVREAWGVPVFDEYSSIEVGNIAAVCPSGHGYHVHDEGVVAEVLDEDGEPCAPGVMGRVVVTSLSNYGFPMIRYEQGDRAVAGAAGPCPCGRGLSRLSSVDGRIWGRLVAVDGTRLCSTFISGGIVAIPHLHQYRIVQEEQGSVEVFIVAAAEFGVEDERQLLETLQARVEGLLTVTMTRVERIERLPGGKHSLVVCKVGNGSDE